MYRTKNKRKQAPRRYYPMKRMAQAYRPEIKFNHNVFTPTNMTTTIQQASVSYIQQGTGRDQRIGNRITPRAVQLKFWIRFADYSNHCRVVVVRLNGKYTGAATDYLATYNSPPNLDRCQVIADRIFSTHITEVTTPSGTSQILDKRIKLNPRKVIKFDGTGPGDHDDNGIMFFWMSDSSAANHPTIEGFFRFFFTDP